VGVGWQREEFEASDLDFDSRGQRLTDLIAACRALWGPSPTDFASESFSFKKIWCEPKPVQPGGPPVWFSGTLGRRNMDRLTRLGDGWIPIMTATADDLAEGRVRIEDAWSAAGRDPARLKVRGSLEVVLGENRRPDLGATLGGAHELARRGATDVQLPMLAFVRTPDALRDWFDELSTRWREVTRG
jgi:alkanesulfonate monooxygenase SsuD/methylene tetrahydromethanopterin reductase-like flavin-dependent oxidoreductase (luciferase family)